MKLCFVVIIQTSHGVIVIVWIIRPRRKAGVSFVFTMHESAIAWQV